VAVLRNTVLTRDNQIQWAKLMKLVNEMSTMAQSAVDDTVASTTEAFNEATEAAMDAIGIEFKSNATKKNGKDIAPAASKTSSKYDNGKKSQRGMQAVASLLGSPEGATLRRIAADLDSTDFFLRLISQEGRVIRRIAAKFLAQKLRAKMSLRRVREKFRSRESPQPSARNFEAAFSANDNTPRETLSETKSLVVPSPKVAEAQKEASDRLARMYGTRPSRLQTGTRPLSISDEENRLTKMPLPSEFKRLQARQKRWSNRMLWKLLEIHSKKQWAAGWRGFLSVTSLMYVIVRVVTEAALRAIFGIVSDVTMSVQRSLCFKQRHRTQFKGP
jgi:hypothetical protein